MKKIEAEFQNEETHSDSNMFALLAICHGDAKDDLMDKNGQPTWNTNKLASQLSSVESLSGKPKLLIIQACRGSKHTSNKSFEVDF